MKYLVMWEGRVTGSMAGRDDGYPEDKMALVSPEFLHEYVDLPKVVFYEVGKSVDVSAIVSKEQQKKKELEDAVKAAKQAALDKLTPQERNVLGLTRFGHYK